MAVSAERINSLPAQVPGISLNQGSQSLDERVQEVAVESLIVKASPLPNPPSLPVCFSRLTGKNPELARKAHEDLTNAVSSRPRPPEKGVSALRNLISRRKRRASPAFLEEGSQRKSIRKNPSSSSLAGRISNSVSSLIRRFSKSSLSEVSSLKDNELDQEHTYIDLTGFPEEPSRRQRLATRPLPPVPDEAAQQAPIYEDLQDLFEESWI